MVSRVHNIILLVITSITSVNKLFVCLSLWVPTLNKRPGRYSKKGPVIIYLGEGPAYLGGGSQFFGHSFRGAP